MQPFAERYSPGIGNLRHNFAGQDDGRGVYAKRIDLKAGEHIVSHEHPYDHLSILASGRVQIEVDGTISQRVGPTEILVRKGLAHSVWAVTDAVWYCIHPTDETDADRIDAAILAGGA